MTKKNTTINVENKEQYKKRSMWAEVWRNYKKNPSAMIGLVIVVALVLLAVFARIYFDFDTDMFREKVEEAGELLAEDFGEDVANAFTDVGNFLADAIDVGLAETPLITGSLEALIKLLNGDFDGGWQTFKDGIEGVNDNIDDLPPELQDTATAIRNLILIFEGLFALNIVTRVADRKSVV